MTHKVKRFVLMAGSKYYACGGFEDYINSFDTREEAESAMNEWRKEQGDDMQDYIWSHVGDLETGEVFGKGQAEATMARMFR